MKFVTQQFRSPWPTQALRSNFSNLFEDFDRFFDSGYPYSSLSTASTQYTPAVDINESEDHYLLSFDVPGIKKEDINIEVQNRVLTVSGERKKAADTKSEFGFRSERSFGTFSRSFQLPESLSTDKIEAHYENGVLQLLLPKAEPAKSKKIEIQSGKEGFLKKILGSKKEEDTNIKEAKIS